MYKVIIEKQTAWLKGQQSLHQALEMFCAQVWKAVYVENSYNAMPTWFLWYSGTLYEERHRAALEAERLTRAYCPPAADPAP